MACPKFFPSFLSLLLFSIFSHSQWTQTPGPEGGYTDEIVLMDDTLVLAAEAGGVYTSKDNGDSWELSVNGLPNQPHVNDIVSYGDTIYVALYYHGVYTSGDKGETWSPANNGINGQSVLSVFAEEQEIYAATFNGQVFHSSDYGASWSLESDGITGYQVSDFVSFNSKIYAATQGGLFENEGGPTWSLIDIPGMGPGGIRSMTVHNGVFYAAEGGVIFISDDNLATWTQISLGSASFPSMGHHENMVYATTGNGIYYHTNDNGQNWTLVQNTETDNYAHHILFLNEKILMTTRDGLYESLNDGISWSFSSLGIKAQQISAFASNDTYIFTGTISNGVFRSDDNGASWEAISNGLESSNTKSIHDIVALDNEVIIGTSSGIYKSTDNGDSWTIKLNPGINQGPQNLAYDNGVLVTTASEDGVYISTDLGETWDLLPTTGLIIPQGFTSIEIQGENLFVSTNSGDLFTSDDLGQTWSNSPVYRYIYDVKYQNGTIYIATANGLWTSTDFGQSLKNFIPLDNTSIQDIIVEGNTVYAASSYGFVVTEEGRENWYPAIDGMEITYTTRLFLKDDTFFLGTYSSSVWSRPKSQITLPPLDDDYDGIPNDDDICPDTPFGEKVNEFGCAESQLDTDQDGVTNNIDLCPDTPEGESVDANGCSDSQKDTDGDGVMDSDDLCPETTSGLEVNESGCAESQLDTDQDGVTNNIDLCPDTPEGESADANGCSDSQKDTDGDGVMDSDDLCPETTNGQEVNESGCAESQLDTDQDGVTNNIDLCPDTPEGESVDANGCSDSQKDTDGDGVVDSKDQCPNTTSGKTVNANGCDFIPGNAISLFTESPTCPNTANGSLNISTVLTGYEFDILLTGENRNESFTTIDLAESLKIDDLSSGTYEISISIPAIHYEQTFGIIINEISNISGKIKDIDTKSMSAKYTVSGSTDYTVEVNGIQKRFHFNSDEENIISIDNLQKQNSISIAGKSNCQGLFTDILLLQEEIHVFPTITSGSVSVSRISEVSDIFIYDASGKLMSAEKVGAETEYYIDLDSYTSGLYIIHIKTNTDTQIFKVIKK
ncbi:thrombospondin type 3 repeat-containing protein [Flagellimonas alvinocaridis]|uniref:thrombospondin type 3 repeat-containing protein n=2 Tax=Flavobacteriales TaxID=200644 RepID=UPI003C7E2125